MNFDPNPLFYWMLKKYSDRDKSNRIILCNEGSSRSSKTFEAFRFIVTYCDHNRNEAKDIYVFRDTLINCKDLTVKDFKRCLGREGLGIYEDKNMIDSPKPYYKLWGQVINFRGLDKESEATKSDLLYFNELLECDKEPYDGWVMRNENIVINDWNPKYTDHWAFNLEKLPNCFFSRTTYKHNKFLPASVIKGIEAYCPWDLSDFTAKGWRVPVSERKPNLENIAAGTVDLYRWLVYGEGVRANKEGLVFPNVTWVDEFPKDVEYISHGMDFGSAAPTAIVKGGFRKKEKKPDLFLQKLHYNPCANSDEVDEVLNILGLGGEEKHLWSDTDFMGKGWIADLRRKGKFIYPTVKYPGSRDYWITTLSRFNIHIVKDPDFRREQENFSYRVVDGKQLSETIKKFDHLWSASGYLAVGDFRELLNNYYGE
jgi:PBSX family phage terminase large subunit